MLAVSSALVAAHPAAAKPPAPTKGDGAADVKQLAGRFVLFMHRIGSQVPDSIVFNRDGSCVFEMGGRTGLVGTCHRAPDGVFTLTANRDPRPILSGKYQRRKYALRLFPDEPSELFYVRWPLSANNPLLPEREVLGKQTSHSRLGAMAQELTADHHFEVRGRDLLEEYRVYFEFQMRGTFSYADGIVTYRPSFSTALEQVDYLHDFVVARDEKCLWIVDPMLDELTCVTRAPSLDIGPPPAGWREGPRNPKAH